MIIDFSKLMRQPTVKTVTIEAWTFEVIGEINKWLTENPEKEFISVEYEHLNGLGTIKITYKN